VAWEQYDATDYENAAVSFSQISCSAGEHALYAYFEGLLWKTQGNYTKSIGAFYRVVRRYPTAVEVQTDIPWKPMAFAEYASYAADMGKPEDIEKIIKRYGAESYAEDRVRWLESRPVSGEPPEVREYSVLPADARVEDVGTYQLARAYAAQGDVAKMKEILQPVASEIYGTIMKDGKVVSLRREVRDLLMRYDPPFTRFMNGLGGVILVLLLLEAVFFGPSLYRKYWVNRKK
jgi:tetratricopeptide (TPR) repeat protein